MRKFLLFTASILLISTPGMHCQSLNDAVGARSAGMGYCSILNRDLPGMFNNQAAMASLKGFQAGVSMDNQFLLEGFNRIGLGISSRVGKGSLFAGVVHFGDQLYSEMKTGAGYALRLGSIVDAGIQLDLLRMHIGEGYGSWYAATFEGGFIITPHQKVSLGIHCFNPLHVKWIGSTEYIPVELRAGVAFQPENAITVCAEILKSSLYKASVSIGCEYQYRQKFFIRAGIRSFPSAITFGAGFKMKQVCVDIASGLSSYLGVSPCISITYSPQK